jgi:phospholipid/cholesterol/gamma-HCH transport system ATP-binding protein
LEFTNVRIAPDQGRLTRLPLNLALQAGELILLGVPYLEQASAIADVATGLVPAKSGSVSFLGHDWSRLSRNAVYALRGRIGRLLTRGRWIEGMSILENILLPQLHHTGRRRDELLHEALESARRFGLPGIPTTAYQDMLPEDLQRAGCVRAFLGSPALVLLPEPTLGSKSDMLPPLVNACLDAMYRGAAILWLTQRNDLVRDSKIPAARRFMINAGALEELHA